MHLLARVVVDRIPQQLVKCNGTVLRACYKCQHMHVTDVNMHVKMRTCMSLMRTCKHTHHSAEHATVLHCGYQQQPPVTAVLVEP